MLWGWTTYRGYQTVRAGDIASHQAWMIRSFALTYAAPTLRLWFGLLIGLQLLFTPGTDFGHVSTNAYAVVPFMCWLPNIVVAELMIRPAQPARPASFPFADRAIGTSSGTCRREVRACGPAGDQAADLSGLVHRSQQRDCPRERRVF